MLDSYVKTGEEDKFRALMTDEPRNATVVAVGRVVAHASAPVSAESDWTTRVLVGHLKPARVYWYRFTDGEGNGSRVSMMMVCTM